MTSKSPQLPAYEDPPVSEVALSVQFEPLRAFRAVHGGLLWSRFRGRFPRVEQHAPLEHRIERTGVRASSPQVGISFLPPAEMTPRLWMLNQSATELIQVQGDRFVRNWRRAGSPDLRYPRYESHLRPEFVSDFSEFQNFLSSEDLGSLTFDQCEVTYVNHMAAGPVWDSPADLHKAFVGWSANYIGQMSQEMEAVGIRARHVLKDDQGEFCGRLFVELDTGFSPPAGGSDSEGQRVLILKLIARGRPLGSEIEGVMKFMDFGHREIVLAFDKLTMPEMHSLWRKIQ